MALDPGYHLARACHGLRHPGQRVRPDAARQLTGINARGGLGSEAWRVQCFGKLLPGSQDTVVNLSYDWRMGGGHSGLCLRSSAKEQGNEGL